MSNTNTARRAESRGPIGMPRARVTLPDRGVLRRMYQLLEESEPSVAVHAELFDDMQGIIDAIISGRTLHYHDTCLIDHDSILCLMALSQDGPRCGIRLLRFMGGLSRALRDRGPITLSVVKALELLTHCQYVWGQSEHQIYLKFKQSGGRCWIQSTDEGTEMFGFPVRIRLPRPPLITEWLPEVFDALV